MKSSLLEVEDLDVIRSSIQALRRELQEDLKRVRQLPESELCRSLRQRTRASQARTDVLLHRLVELRLLIDSRRRTLERLRVQLSQLRGSTRPH